MDEHKHTVQFWSRDLQVPWAPHADVATIDRIDGVCFDKCKECIADLTVAIANNIETLAVAAKRSLGLLLLHQEPKLTWLEGRLHPYEPLSTVIARIQRMGTNATSSSLIGMLRTFRPEDHLAIAAAAIDLTEQFFEQLRLRFLEEQRHRSQQNPWWQKK